MRARRLPDAQPKEVYNYRVHLRKPDLSDFPLVRKHGHWCVVVCARVCVCGGGEGHWIQLQRAAGNNCCAVCLMCRPQTAVLCSTALFAGFSMRFTLRH